MLGRWRPFSTPAPCQIQCPALATTTSVTGSSAVGSQTSARRRNSSTSFSRAVRSACASVDAGDGLLPFAASLAKARGRVKTREALLDECRDRNYEVFDRSIDVHISSLRRKLGDDAKEPRYIRTVRSAGYMMVGPE